MRSMTAARRMRDMTEADLPTLPDSVQALFFGGISLVGDPCGAAYCDGSVRRRATVWSCWTPISGPGLSVMKPPIARGWTRCWRAPIS
jgi:hypothetical protein